MNETPDFPTLSQGRYMMNKRKARIPRTFRLDKIELRIAGTFYVEGATAIYVDDTLHSVRHPNPYRETDPVCEIPAAMMKQKNAEILTTLDTLREVVQ